MISFRDQDISVPLAIATGHTYDGALSVTCLNPTTGVLTDPLVSPAAVGQPGLPGRQGAPGKPGIPGAGAMPGQKGEKGLRGDKGIPGKTGARPGVGFPGKRGDSGAPGSGGKPGGRKKYGKHGEYGDYGRRGSTGEIEQDLFRDKNITKTILEQQKAHEEYYKKNPYPSTLAPTMSPEDQAAFNDAQERAAYAAER